MKAPSLSSLCTPALVYFVISVLAILGAIMSQLSLGAIAWKVVFVLTWTWVLNLLCRRGLETLSWILVILPYVFFIIVVVLGLDILATQNPATNSSQQKHQVNGQH